MAAEMANVITRARAGEMPIDCDATSLPRTALRVRPVVDSPNNVTPVVARAKITNTRARNILSFSKSQGPITGRGTGSVAAAPLADPPTHENFTMTEVKKKPNASVAMAIQMPFNRIRGSDSSAPTTAAMQAPMRAPTSTGTSKRSTSWKTANPPMAANAPWQSEMCPPKPVITVIDKNTMASAADWVTRKIHTASPRVNSTTPHATRKAVPRMRRMAMRFESATACVCDDGGGSTPASGSLARCV